MFWPRPVPLVGDATSSRQRAQDPHGWAFPPEVRAAFYDVVRSRRDVRRYRPDPVDEATLERVLGAAHAAPSVGHSQPWRFILVSDPAFRERAAFMADRERLAQAARLEPERARRLLDLQLEGIREAPLGIVVCCDRRTQAAGVLGRATFPDADLWSCACAIENLWLAARTEGLGLGWVTFFRPDELADLLRLPEGVVTLGWLCVGWPDERPPEPGLERAGWSRKQPLEEVVFFDRWPGDEAGPAAPPSHGVRAPDQAAVVSARDHSDALLTPAGSLGVLDRAVDRVAALGGVRADGGTLLLVGADHPVTAHGVSAFSPSVTGDVMRAALAGEALGVVAARSAGLATRVVDAGVGDEAIEGAEDARPSHPRGDLVAADALAMPDVLRLLERGREFGRTAAAEGVVALGEVGIGNTTVAAALAAVLLDRPPAEMAGLGAGADTPTVERKREALRRAVSRARAEHAGGLDDPRRLLSALGGPEICVLAGAVLGAAGARGVVVLDGLATSVAALLAVLLEPGASACLIAGQRSREEAHAAVLAHLGLEPLLDLRIRSGEGAGAALAAGLLLAGLRVRRETGRTGRPA